MNNAGKFLLKIMGIFEEYVSMCMLTITMIVTVINVFARYLFKSSLPWSQEISGIAWCWTVMLGISWAFRTNLHQGIDLLVQKVSIKLKRILYIISFIILAFSFVFLTYMSLEITIKGVYKLTNYFKLPYSIKYASAAIAFFNMTVYSLRYVVIAIKDPKKFINAVSINGSGLDDFDTEVVGEEVAK